MTEHALSTIGAGIFVGILGVLIKYVGVVDLIAGYDPEKVADQEGLADFVGTNALYVAVLTVCIGVLELQPSAVDSEWYWILFVLAIVVIAVRMIRGARRYESTSEQNNTN
jgi:bacteriorhodopsin